MSTVHGSRTYYSLDGKQVSLSGNANTWERTADSHDTTVYATTTTTASHVFAGGLGGGTSTIGGFYDNSTNTGQNAKATIEPLVGTVVAFIERPEGTGSGLPQRSVNVLVTKYTESKPVADMVTWSVDLQHSGTVTYSTQT
jgi:hypothetical protein